MNVLVTGANGFVGKALCQFLCLNQHSVIAVSRQTQKRDLLHYHSIGIGNIDNNTDWSLAIKDVDVVIHLAARVHVMKEDSSDFIGEFLSVNLHGTLKLFDAAVKAGVKRFVYVSTIKVNGENTNNRPFSEVDIPKPKDCYALSKWLAEQALWKASEKSGLDLVVVRPPLIYGPGVKANFSSLLNILYRQIPMPFGAISNLRSLIYVENLVDALSSCAFHPKAKGKTFLVSDGEDVSTPDLIKKIANALNKSCWILPVPLFIIRFIVVILGRTITFDRLTESLVVDSSKIREELDWSPPYSMEQGLKITADLYAETLASNKK